MELEAFTASASVKDLQFDAKDSNNADSSALPRQWASVLTPEHILMDLNASTVPEAIKEMTDHLAKYGLLKDPEKCMTDVLQREKAFSTCMPGGIALPHARTREVTTLRSVFGISRSGCFRTEEKNPADEKVHILVMSLCPPEFNNPYLQYVSHIAGILAKEKNIAQIKSAKTPQEVFKILAGDPKTIL